MPHSTSVGPSRYNHSAARIGKNRRRHQPTQQPATKATQATRDSQPLWGHVTSCLKYRRRTQQTTDQHQNTPATPLPCTVSLLYACHANHSRISGISAHHISGSPYYTHRSRLAVVSVPRPAGPCHGPHAPSIHSWHPQTHADTDLLPCHPLSQQGEAMLACAVPRPAGPCRTPRRRRRAGSCWVEGEGGPGPPCPGACGPAGRRRRAGRRQPPGCSCMVRKGANQQEEGFTKGASAGLARETHMPTRVRMWRRMVQDTVLCAWAARSVQCGAAPSVGHPAATMA